MTIAEAINNAKFLGNWNVANHEPTSVNIHFTTIQGDDDETQLDLYSDDFERELTELWESMCVEFETTPDGVYGVESLGYIAD